MGALLGILHDSSPPRPLAGCRLVCKIILPALPFFFFFFLKKQNPAENKKPTSGQARIIS